MGTDTLNAAYSDGSATATYTAARSAGAPATYVDASGVVQLLTSANVRRRQGGYYDATGFHAQAGEMIEAAGTNLIVRSDGTAYSGGLWTGWSAYDAPHGSVTRTNVAVPELTSITSSDSQRVQYTGDASDTNASISQSGASTAAGSVVQNAVVTISGWLRSQTGFSSSPKIGFLIRNSSEGGVAQYLSSALAPTTSWCRFTYTATVTNATADRARPLIVISGVDNGEANDVEYWGIQIEVSPYATSFIPTTTASLTRPAEVLKYVNAGNRTASQESIFVKFAPEWNGTDMDATRRLLSDDSQSRQIRITNGDVWQFFTNIIDSSLSQVISTTIPSINTSAVIGVIAYGETAGTNSAFYYNGSSQATNTTNYITPNFGVNFALGNTIGGSQINGLIQSVVFFNHPITAGEAVTITAILNSSDSVLSKTYQLIAVGGLTFFKEY